MNFWQYLDANPVVTIIVVLGILHLIEETLYTFRK